MNREGLGPHGFLLLDARLEVTMRSYVEQPHLSDYLTPGRGFA